jgi:hypothetical protein
MPRRNWEDNIKVDINVVGYEDEEWIHLPIVVLWVVTPCRIVSKYCSFRGTFCLHHQG